MKRWQYTRMETVEISVPDTIDNVEDACGYLLAHPEAGTVVDTFIGEAHEIKERKETGGGQDRENYTDDQDRENYLDSLDSLENCIDSDSKDR